MFAFAPNEKERRSFMEFLSLEELFIIDGVF
jgi:hypothetical protein